MMALGPAPDSAGRLDAASCQICPEGTVSNADGVCEVCPHTVVGNTCTPCPADLELDGATMEQSLTITPTTGGAGDACPDYFWVEIRNPGGLFARGAESIDVSLMPAPQTQANCRREYSLTTALPDAGGSLLNEVVTATGSWTTAAGGVIVIDPCVGLPARTFGAAEASVAVMRVGTPVMSNSFLRIDASTPEVLR